MQTHHSRPQDLGKELSKLFPFPFSLVQLFLHLYSLPLLDEKSKYFICVVAVHKSPSHKWTLLCYVLYKPCSNTLFLPMNTVKILTIGLTLIYSFISTFPITED